MNSKKIMAILVALVLCRATLYLFAAPSTAATSMSTPALQNTIVQSINQLITQLKNKTTSPEEAQVQLNQIYDLVEAYEQRPDKVAANVASFNSSLAQVIPKFIATASVAAGCPPCPPSPAPRSCPACPPCPAPSAAPSFPTPQMQALLREANATTIDEAILNIQKLKAQANPEVQALVGVLRDVGMEVEEPENPEINRDLEKLLASLNATTAKEARKNVKALEASVEKRMMGIAKNTQTIYLIVAENANSQKLRDMINKYTSVEDFLKSSVQKALNQEIADLLYRARTDIFFMKHTLLDLEMFFRSNPTLHPPRREISSEVQKQEVAKISLN